ncbi:MAG: GNAT family N-acetyltransferase [Candidatus Bipolaricaulota bacterium]
MAAKRIPMSVQLKRQTLVKDWASRTIRTSDAHDLAILLYAAFRGTIDDEGETFADAVREINKTFAGDYGRLLPDCSFTIQDGEFIASACLISWFEPHNAPLVAFTMTRPTHKRQGMARFLLNGSINALIDRGYSQLTLIVTDGNEPAQKLYASTGFREMPTPQSRNC